MRIISTGLAALILMLIGACADSAKPQRIGDVDYCVPKWALVQGDYWWIPKSLPVDGFVFELHGKQLPEWILSIDRKGKGRSLGGHVAPDGIYDPNFPMLAAQADRSEALIERDIQSGLVFVYESARRTNWTIWRLPGGVAPKSASLSTIGSLVVSCRSSAGVLDDDWKGATADCNRWIWITGATIQYTTAFENLSRIIEIDEVVRNHVLSWRCPTTTGG